MDKIIIPASITIERGTSIYRYKWLSDKSKESTYRKKTRRAVIRFTCKTFAEKINELNIVNRQISIQFKDSYHVNLKRSKYKNTSMQGYSGKHPYIQIVINKYLPIDMWDKLKRTEKKSISFPIKVEINLSEWKDVKLSPWDFLIEIEKEAKSLMKKALKKGFKSNKISKGRSHDLSLISPQNKEFVIAISSHMAKSNSRSKEKTIQKILMDISKMLPYLDGGQKAIPVILTRPIDFEKSWSFTTKNYLDFYRKRFGFKFLTTEFKKGWEDNIIKELIKIENE